ncbi:MAG: hypothetical protein R3D70_22685 [Rhizobiaceae bacterium]
MPSLHDPSHPPARNAGSASAPVARPLRFPAHSTGRSRSPISISPAITDLIERGAAVAVGVSGGKDSQAAAMATFAHLDDIGHVGPRILIHADLGFVE